ncbi:MAG TPA: methyltransferase domain-containing protein [Terriglobales bacterium]|nr:methyltransferase domain-containing protein [Terriglobales bacterium]
MAGFPRDLLALLRCCRDAGPLELAAESQGDDGCVIEGRLRCATCGGEYRVEQGIARLMPATLTAEDEHEMSARDRQNASADAGLFVAPMFGWRSRVSDLLEIPPHLDALQPEACTVLECGCGDGRFTILMAQLGARVLAVDFSINALRALASRLPSGIAPTAYRLRRRAEATDVRGRVGLVQGDASRFHAAPRAFDRALATTPLDSRDERMAMYRTIADALTDQGRFVGSVECDDLTRRLLGLPVARRYSSGILIQHFDAAELRREAAPYFGRLRLRLIRPRIPFQHRLSPRWTLGLSRLLGAVPVLRCLGEILLFRAERPRRPPVEGAKRSGIRPVQRFYRWYMRKIGKAPLWEDHEPV